MTINTLSSDKFFKVADNSFQYFSRGRYNHSMLVDANIMVSTNCPN